MSLLSASNLAKSYGHNTILADISLSIPRAARIAIVGANGIGKTTLLRLLVGLEEPSEGRVQCVRQSVHVVRDALCADMAHRLGRCGIVTARDGQGMARRGRTDWQVAGDLAGLFRCRGLMRPFFSNCW